jgi:hypothetical protein
MTKRSLRVKPDSSGCILLQKLAYGEYDISLSAKDCIDEKIKKVIVKETKPVFLDFRMKSSVIQLIMELSAYTLRPIPVTAQTSWPMAEELKARKLAEAEYKVYAQKQKQEHEQLKNVSWQMIDGLRNDSITDLKTWHERMRKTLRFPQDAIDGGIDGKVYFGFETDEKGNIQNIELLRGHDAELAVGLAHALKQGTGHISS